MKDLVEQYARRIGPTRVWATEHALFMLAAVEELKPKTVTELYRLLPWAFDLFRGTLDRLTAAGVLVAEHDAVALTPAGEEMIATLRELAPHDDGGTERRATHENRWSTTTWGAATDAVTAFLPHMLSETRSMMILSVTLREVLGGPLAEAAKRKIAEGVRVRVLLMAPTMGEIRDRQESRNLGGTATDILRAIEHVRGWGGAELRLYRGVPTMFGIWTSTAILLRPYTLLSEGAMSPTLVLAAGTDVYRNAVSVVFRAWDTALAESVVSPQE